jgi:hypothetical protein
MESQASRKRRQNSNVNYETFFESSESESVTSNESEPETMSDLVNLTEENAEESQASSSKKKRASEHGSSSDITTNSRKKTKPIWNFFRKTARNKSKCTLCGLNIVATHFNCFRHIRRKHPKELESLQTETSRAKATAELAKVNNVRKIRVKINSAILLKSCVGLVTEDALPFRVFDSKNMRNITNPIVEGLEQQTGEKHKKINARNVRELVKKSAAQIRESIKTQMQNQIVCLKIDGATRHNKTVFGISVQYCKNEQV